MDIECPNPAYKRLLKAGLDRRIMERKGILMHLLLNLVDDESDEMFKRVEKTWNANHRGKISERTKLYEDLYAFVEELDNEDEFVSHEDKEMRPVKHPSLLAYAVLGEDVLKFSEFGFPTRRSLEETITSFCIGEGNRIKSWTNEYSWRRRNKKSWLSNGFHGDLWFGQMDVSGEDRKEQTLFGEIEVFDTMKDVGNTKRNVIADWVDWKTFLIASLKYANAIGKGKMPEIINWRETLEKAGGGVGTFTSEAMFGDVDSPWEIEWLGKSYVLEEGKTVYDHQNMPLTIMSGIDNSRTLYLPYVSQGNLVYVRSVGEGEAGEITLPLYFLKGKRFTPHITFTPEDLPELLAGTYRLFARDRRIMPKIINMFLTEQE